MYIYILCRIPIEALFPRRFLLHVWEIYKSIHISILFSLLIDFRFVSDLEINQYYFPAALWNGILVGGVFFPLRNYSE